MAGLGLGFVIGDCCAHAASIIVVRQRAAMRAHCWCCVPCCDTERERMRQQQVAAAADADEPMDLMMAGRAVCIEVELALPARRTGGSPPRSVILRMFLQSTKPDLACTHLHHAVPRHLHRITRCCSCRWVGWVSQTETNSDSDGFAGPKRVARPPKT